MRNPTAARCQVMAAFFSRSQPRMSALRARLTGRKSAAKMSMTCGIAESSGRTGSWTSVKGINPSVALPSAL